ncbi:unnamed protein product [Rotaria socialis]|uniref:EGF-like domain-containing protein n=1 Tax=Rotaria socialis TaxID=392032 RepID=A0A820M4N0_9BILA|nr:unnamed protein product [Rotaria socialis]CAF4366460.1 unnamed protein product [Rotaria socialis]
MISFSKYKTSEISSSVNYVSRFYNQNFLAYSPHHDLLIFIEPKHQLHVYNAQTIRLIVNLPTSNIIFATSCTSLSMNDHRDVFFVYESHLESNILLLRVCEMSFNKIILQFEEKICVQTLKISSNKTDIQVTGFTIKRNHAGTENSILFISTDIGLIYTIFKTYSGILINEPAILTDTLNEGNVVTTSSGIIYYANKQENTIHELRITHDFRIRYGKIIKSNGIKSPFGLLTDECNHLFITTRALIFIMSLQKYATIRSVSSKTSYLPITLERLNSTLYVYTTVRTDAEKKPSNWMFHFLSFIDPEKPVFISQPPVVNTKQSWDFSSIKTNTAQIYTPFASTSTNIDEETSMTTPSDSTTYETSMTTPSDSTTYETSVSLMEFQKNSSNGNIPYDVNTTINSLELLIAANAFTAGFPDKKDDLSLNEITLLQTNITQELLANSSLYPESTFYSTDPSETVSVTSSEILESNSQNLTFVNSLTTSNIIDGDTTSVDNITISTGTFDEYTQFSTLNSTFTAITMLSTDDNDQDFDEKNRQDTSEINEDKSTVPLSLPSESENGYLYSSTITPPNESISWIENASSTTSFNNDSNDSLSEKFPAITYQPMNETENSTSFMTVTDVVNQEMTLEMNQNNASLLSIDANVSATLYSSSPFIASSTVSISTMHSSLSSSLHRSHSLLSTKPTKVNRLSTSREFLATTQLISASTTASQMTDPVHVTDITKKSSTSAFSEESSSLPTTTTTTTTHNDRFTSKFSTIVSNESLTSTTFLEPSTIDYTTLKTSNDDESLAVTTAQIFEATTELSTLSSSTTDEHSTLAITYSSTKSSRSSTKEFDTYRTRKRKNSRRKSRTSTITTNVAFVQTTNVHHSMLTSTLFSIYHSNLTFSDHTTFIIKPSLTTNILLSNELFKELLNSTSNYSTEKCIYLNLIDIPPSSWNLSLNTTESVVLDIALPPSSHMTGITNLTMGDIEANHLSTNIIGLPINLQVDNVHASKFSLSMNQTDNNVNQLPSNLIIGRIKAEQFELNLIKSDNMDINVQQIDSETADIYLDSQFCANDNTLGINLNLTKNGTIRYGNQKPIHIGPVVTRLSMPKQSCGLDQPLKFFFDICQTESPCLNGGTCTSLMPDYDKESSDEQSTEIRYQCSCPLDISGDHCQYLKYPFGFCTNGGTLIEVVGLNNKKSEQCLCPEGFQGDFCEDNIDDCTNIKCSHHGICKDDMNSYKCLCFDGYYGNQCEERSVQTVLFQIATKSFAIVAILLIVSIACLAIACDIHTYLTRHKQVRKHRLNKIRHTTSREFENSVCLLDVSNALIEMNDLSTMEERRKSRSLKHCSKYLRNQCGYQQISINKHIKTSSQQLSEHYISLDPIDKTIL